MDIQIVDYTSKTAPGVFTKSLKETGFAVLTNHPVEDGLIEEVYDEWREFLKYLGEEKNGEFSTEGGDTSPKSVSDPLSPATLTPASSVTPATSSLTPTTDMINQFDTSAKGELRFGNMDILGNDSAIVKPSGISEPMFNRSGFKKTTSTTTFLSDEYLFDPIRQDGYFPQTVSETAKGAIKKDLKHYFHCYLTGRYPKEVSSRARVLQEKMLKLGTQLVQWIDDNMSDEIRAKLPKNMRNKGLAEWVSTEQTLLRVLHYPAYKKGTEEPGAIRAAAHEDINCITVLPAGSTKGLQVRCPKTQQWFDVPCIRGSLVINIGDMLQECSQKEYVSTTHRVIKPDEPELEGLDRMSTPCFIHFKPETYLSEKYLTAEQFLHERLKELGVMK